MNTNLIKLQTIDEILENLYNLLKLQTNNYKVLNPKEKYLYKDLNENTIDNAISLVFRIKNEIMSNELYHDLSTHLYGSP